MLVLGYVSVFVGVGLIVYVFLLSLNCRVKINFLILLFIDGINICLVYRYLERMLGLGGILLEYLG